MNYNYSGSKAYAKQIGMTFDESWASDFDQQAKAFNFTQAQVDMALQHHLHQMKHIFTPSTYTMKQRILIALCFIFGKGFKNAQ